MTGPEHRPEDPDLDAFLAGNDPLHKAYRALDGEQPPPALDAAILAEARKALTPRPAQRPRPARRPRPRWPLGLAATVLLSVALVPQLLEQQRQEQELMMRPASSALPALPDRTANAAAEPAGPPDAARQQAQARAGAEQQARQERREQTEEADARQAAERAAAARARAGAAEKSARGPAPAPAAPVAPLPPTAVAEPAMADGVHEDFGAHAPAAAAVPSPAPPPPAAPKSPPEPHDDRGTVVDAETAQAFLQRPGIERLLHRAPASQVQWRILALARDAEGRCPPPSKHAVDGAPFALDAAACELLLYLPAAAGVDSPAP